MKAFLLSTGELMHPITVKGPGSIGDGMALARPGTALYAQWQPLAVHAGPREEEVAARLRGQQENRPA